MRIHSVINIQTILSSESELLLVHFCNIINGSTEYCYHNAYHKTEEVRTLVNKTYKIIYG